MKRIALWAGALLLALGAASSASAITCDALVSDDANVFKGNLPAVEQAAQDLVNDGIDVRAFTIKDHGRNTMDQFVAATKDKCPSWQDTEGHNKNNIVIIGIEMAHHGAGIYFGKMYDGALGPIWQDIRQKEMVPNLRDGNFALAFTAALGRIKTEIAADHARSLRPQVAAAPAVVAPVVIQQSNSHAGEAFVRFLLIAFLIGIVVLGIAFGAKAWAARSEKEEKLKGIRLRANNAKGSCGQFIRGFDNDYDLLSASANALKSVCSADELGSILQSVGKIQAEGKSISETYSNLSSQNDPSRSDITVAECMEVAQTYEALEKRVSQLLTSMNTVSTAITQKRTEAEAAPAKLAETDKHIESAKIAIEGAAKEGYKRDPFDHALANVKQLREAASDQLSKRQFSKVLQTAAKAATDADTICQKIKDLPKLRAEIDKGITSLAGAIQQTEALVEATRPIFTALKTAYVESSWHAIAGNGSQAEACIGRAKAGLEAVRLQAGMEQQQWVEAQIALDDLNDVLKEAVTLLQNISKLKDGLADAKEKCHAEIAHAKADIQKAADYMGQNVDDVDPRHTAELQNARQHLAVAEAEFKQAMPDYLLVVKTALEATKAADQILESATTEHETMVRKRRTLTSTLEEADRSIETAADYCEKHRKLIGTHPLSMLDAARQQVKEARGKGRSLDQMIQAATLADQNADGALTEAKKKVRAEQERLEAIRQEAEDRREREREAEEERHRQSSTVIINDSFNSGSRSRSSDDSPSLGGGSSIWGKSDDSPLGGGSDSWGSSSGGSFGGGGNDKAW